LIAKIKNPFNNEIEYFVTSSCECQRAELESRGETFWTCEMSKDLIVEWASGKSKKEYSEFIDKKYDIGVGKNRSGKYEWRSPSTKKIENIRSAQIPESWHTLFDFENIYDESIEKCAAYTFSKRLEKNPKTWIGFERIKEEGDKNKTLLEYDSSLCDFCHHEKGAHNDGYCSVCKKQCW
jgi:hypothetical protein